MVTDETLKKVIDAILENSKMTDLDMYNDIFEDRISMFKHILEGYFHKVEGRSCCVDKARYVARMVDKTLKNNEYYPLKETYGEYQNRGGDIGSITELDEVAYWCPETLKTTEEALELIYNNMKYKEDK